ncbi:MAG: hypothetical protein C4298_05665 [Thermus sp.]
MRPIERDLERFKAIVRGEIQKRAREFLTREEFLGQLEGRLVSIPLPQLELPKIVYGEEVEEGLGLGPGGEGLGPGGHIPVAELELEEFLDLMGEALKLPRLRPKGEGEVTEEAFRYTTIARKGPRGLRHVRRTLKEALKRGLLSGEYRPEVDKAPRLIPEREDFRYKAPKARPRPHAQAVVVFAYELFQAQTQKAPFPKEELASTAALEALFSDLGRYILEIGFTDQNRFPYAMRRLRRIFHKARLSPGEVQMLRGLLHQSRYAMGRKDGD